MNQNLESLITAIPESAAICGCNATMNAKIADFMYAEHSNGWPPPLVDITHEAARKSGAV